MNDKEDTNKVRGWGHHVWSTIHLVALGYPEHPMLSEREAYRVFYESIGNVLPCEKCRSNFSRHVASNDISQFLGSRQKLFEWTVYLHNSVNKELGKPLWNVEYALSLYKRASTKAHHERSPIKTMWVLTGINIVVLIAVVWTMIKRRWKLNPM